MKIIINKNNIFRFFVFSLFSLFLSLACIYPLNMPNSVKCILFSSLFIVFLIISTIINCYSNTHNRKLIKNESFLIKHNINTKLLYILLFLLFCVLYSLLLLSNYPGFLTPDSTDTIKQALGNYEGTFGFRYDSLSSHHSVLYTLLFRFVYNVISIFSDNINFSIFTFLLVQIIILSAIFTYSIIWAIKRCKNRIYTLVLILFLSFNPVIMAHSYIMGKDIVYSLIILLLSLKLFDVCNYHSKNKIDYILLAFLMVAVCLLRQTGIFICVILIILFLIFKHIKIKYTIILFSFLLAVLFIINGPLSSILNIQKAHFSESVSVPLQQIACVVSSDGNISTEQEHCISQILPLNDGKALYNKSCVNSIKFSNNFNDNYLDNHKLEFIYYGAQIGLSNLKLYINAWLNETLGFGSPTYLLSFPLDSIKNFVVFNPGNNSINSLNKVNFGIQPGNFSTSGLFIFIFYNCGFLPGIIIAYLIFYKFKYNIKCYQLFKNTLGIVPSIVTLLIVILNSPINFEFRYVYNVYLLVPFLPCFGKNNNLIPTRYF